MMCLFLRHLPSWVSVFQKIKSTRYSVRQNLWQCSNVLGCGDMQGDGYSVH
jgi:hypothetical protein